MNLLFFADPLSGFKIYKDTTYAMMRAAQNANHQIFFSTMAELKWEKKVMTQWIRIELTPNQDAWYNIIDQGQTFLCEFDVVIMRKDPPFDNQYFLYTHLLEQAEREGARVINSPLSLRNHPEKLSILEFSQFLCPTLVSSQTDSITEFHAKHQDIILKPLDAMGGTGIFRVAENGLNLGSIVETLTKYGQQTIMVQKYIEAIRQGDKRILIIAGQVVPYCLARIPQGQEIRGNLAAGGKGVAQALTEQDWSIANSLAPILWRRGLFLVGLDVIGDYLTEINVTNTTCFQEIHQQTNWDVAAFFVQELENFIGASQSSPKIENLGRA